MAADAYVTYQGPEDELDSTTILEIPSDEDGEPNARFPLGVEVKTTKAIAERAKNVNGHKVTVSSSAKTDSPADPNDAAPAGTG